MESLTRHLILEVLHHQLDRIGRGLPQTTDRGIGHRGAKFGQQGLIPRIRLHQLNRLFTAHTARRALATAFILKEFQHVDGGGLYKMRYSTGVNYKLFKNNYLGINYKFDYYNTEYLNKHIISLGYKIKF